MSQNPELGVNFSQWLSVPFGCSILTCHFNTSYLVAYLGHLILGCMPWILYARLHALDTSCLVDALDTSCLVACLGHLMLDCMSWILHARLHALGTLCSVACFGYLMLGCMHSIAYNWLHASISHTWLLTFDISCLIACWRIDKKAIKKNTSKILFIKKTKVIT